MFQEIVCLHASKACQDTNVPTKIIKENADIFIDFIYLSINASINNGDFPSFLRVANVIPVFKKDCKNSKDNYIPISILKNREQDNCPPDNCPPDNCPPDNCPPG